MPAKFPPCLPRNLGISPIKKRPSGERAFLFLFPYDFLGEDFRIQKILPVRMASMEEEELSVTVEGPGVHGNPLLFQELSHLFIALSTAHHGSAEENGLAHLVRRKAFDEILHMAVNMAFINAAADEKEVHPPAQGLICGFRPFSRFPGNGSGCLFRGTAAAVITNCNSHSIPSYFLILL